MKNPLNKGFLAIDKNQKVYYNIDITINNQNTMKNIQKIHNELTPLEQASNTINIYEVIYSNEKPNQSIKEMLEVAHPQDIIDFYLGSNEKFHKVNLELAKLKWLESFKK